MSQYAYDQSCSKINGRMLLHKYSGNADQDAGRAKEKFPAWSLQLCASPSGESDCQGTHHMEGRTDIGAGIEGIKCTQHLGQQVIPGKDGGPEILTGRKQEKDDQSRGICDNDVAHEILKKRYVEQQQIYMHTGQKDEPEKIGDKKPLTERNLIVQRAVHRKIRRRQIPSLRHIKQDTEQWPEQQQTQMLEFGRVQFTEPELTVIYHSGKNALIVSVLILFHRRLERRAPGLGSPLPPLNSKTQILSGNVFFEVTLL